VVQKTREVLPRDPVNDLVHASGIKDRSWDRTRACPSLHPFQHLAVDEHPGIRVQVGHGINVRRPPDILDAAQDRVIFERGIDYPRVLSTP